MYESTDKMVSHPDHYQAENGMEVINVIEAFTAGLTGVEAYDAGNIIKYACRWSKKNGIQDLEKIIWYATHLIEHLKRKNGETIKPEEDVEEEETAAPEPKDTDDGIVYPHAYSVKYIFERYSELHDAGKIHSTILSAVEMFNAKFTVNYVPGKKNTIYLECDSFFDEYFTYNSADDWSFEGGYEYKEAVEECYGTIDDEEGIKAMYTRQEIYNRFVELVKEGKMLTEAALNEIHSYRDVEGVPNMIDIIGKDECLIYTFYMVDYDHYVLYDEDEDVIVGTME